MQIRTHAENGVQISQSDRALLVTARDFCVRFDLWKGVPDEITRKGRRILSEPMTYNFWRAPVDNDRKIMGAWIAAGYDRLKIRVYDWNVEEKEDGVHVAFRMGVAGQFLQKANPPYSDGGSAGSCVSLFAPVWCAACSAGGV